MLHFTSSHFRTAYVNNRNKNDSTSSFFLTTLNLTLKCKYSPCRTIYVTLELCSCSQSAYTFPVQHYTAKKFFPAVSRNVTVFVVPSYLHIHVIKHLYTLFNPTIHFVTSNSPKIHLTPTWLSFLAKWLKARKYSQSYQQYYANFTSNRLSYSQTKGCTNNSWRTFGRRVPKLLSIKCNKPVATTLIDAV
jgi:hypothetical protein